MQRKKSPDVIEAAARKALEFIMALRDATPDEAADLLTNNPGEDIEAELAAALGLAVSITAGFPGLVETVIHRCATVEEAEDFLATSATIDPEHLVAGHYGIDAPEEMVNPD